MPDHSNNAAPSSGGLARIRVPGTDESLVATLIDDTAFVALKPMCEALGIDTESQRRKLKAKSWSVAVMNTATGADGKNYEMFMIDRRTMTMWLATIDENRVAEQARPTVQAFQREAADALDAYFHTGGAINPNATTDQLGQLARRAHMQMEVIRLADGIIDAKHLEAKARIVLASAMGEKPEIDPANVPLYVSDYLKAKGLASDMIAAKASGFGRRLKGLYVSEHGQAPQKFYQELPNGTVREVFAYTQNDRPLFDQVWNRHYEGVTRAVGGAA
ncbi:phage antirepressor N-terminal domain-containing protein [Nocardia sp. CA-128927]|uniref:phage antirepressor N-terminal domain-containing protein n=1 Tax=Nocardia sp. CA-128927 TaxID=3239975 RepID=UPI003D95CDEE